MAEAIMVVGLAMSAFQVYQSIEGAQEAEEIGKENEKRIKMESEEAARREKFNLAREQAVLRARIAAGGIGGETPKTYYEAYTTQRENEIKWMKTAGKHGAKIARREGDRARNIGYAQAAGAAAKGAFQSYNWFSTYVNKQETAGSAYVPGGSLPM